MSKIKTPNFIDSSDSEGEDAFLNKQQITNLKSYSKYIARNFNLEQAFKIEESNTFTIKLGFILHNFADRVMNSKYFRDTYKTLKNKHLGLSEEEYNLYSKDIKNAFLSNSKFSKHKELKNVDEKEFIKLYCSLFNYRIKTPESIKKFVSIDTALSLELKNLLANKIKLPFQSEYALTLSRLDEENALDFLALPLLSSRNNKNNLKNLELLEAKSHPSHTTYKIPNSIFKSFTDDHLLKTQTGNIVTHIGTYGKYTELFSDLAPLVKNKESLFKTHITKLLQNKDTEADYGAADMKLMSMADKITHLMFLTETQRNATTIFTAPMFLDMLEKSGADRYKEFKFPMSVQGAVKMSRWINKDATKLPNTHFMDYDQKNVKQDNQLLKLEGELFIKWLSNVAQDSSLLEITSLLDVITQIKVMKSKFQQGKVSLSDLHNILDTLSSIKIFENDLTPLIKSINCPDIGNGWSSLVWLKIKKSSDEKALYNLYYSSLCKKLSTPEYAGLKDEIEAIFKFVENNLADITPHLNSLNIRMSKAIPIKVKEAIGHITELCDEWYNIKVHPDKIFKHESAVDENIDDPMTANNEVVDDNIDVKNIEEQADTIFADSFIFDAPEEEAPENLNKESFEKDNKSVFEDQNPDNISFSSDIDINAEDVEDDYSQQFITEEALDADNESEFDDQDLALEKFSEELLNVNSATLFSIEKNNEAEGNATNNGSLGNEAVRGKKRLHSDDLDVVFLDDENIDEYNNEEERSFLPPPHKKLTITTSSAETNDIKEDISDKILEILNQDEIIVCKDVVTIGYLILNHIRNITPNPTMEKLVQVLESGYETHPSPNFEADILRIVETKSLLGGNDNVFDINGDV